MCGPVLLSVRAYGVKMGGMLGADHQLLLTDLCSRPGLLIAQTGGATYLKHLESICLGLLHIAEL